MTRTSFMIPNDLHARAKLAARKAGVSLGEFLRDAIRQGIQSNAQSVEDPLFELEIYEGPAPRDGAANHDHFLYGAPRRR